MTGSPSTPLVAAPPQLKRDLENCDIGGLGIHLIRRLVDDVRYTRRSNRNELTLIKHPEPSHETRFRLARYDQAAGLTPHSQPLHQPGAHQ